MLRSWLRALLAEPRVPDAPTRVWRDWLLSATVAIGAVLEASFRPDVVWRPAATFVCFGVLAPALLWRRTHPLAALGLVFGSVIALTAGADLAGRAEVGLYTTAFLLVLVYTLFRWASGRDVLIGSVIIAATWLISLIAEPGTLGDAIGGAVVLLLPMAVGQVVRYQFLARERLVDDIASREREQLARELHDTVAHHVSAIAIQAQAGRVLSATRPAAAVEALAVIEEAASRTLEDMRSMVKGLRNGSDAALAPQHGVADLRRLMSTSNERLAVSVEVDPHLGVLRPSLDAAIYRIAQESVTNAQRHARNASVVLVRVEPAGDDVRVTVTDDGNAPAALAGSTTTGFGLLGMAERAKVLGGRFSAGPLSGRGWQVRAEFPRAHS